MTASEEAAHSEMPLISYRILLSTSIKLSRGTMVGLSFTDVAEKVSSRGYTPWRVLLQEQFPYA